MVNITVSQLGLKGQNGEDASALLATDGILIQEDWLSATSVGNHGFTLSTSNGGSTSVISAEENHLGICQISTGSSSSTGYGNLYLGSGNLKIGYGTITIEALVRFPTLSNSSEQYTCRIGLGDTLTGDFSYGIWLEYNQNTSLNWLLCSNSNTSATKTVSSTAVTENTWIKIKIVINAAGNSVEYFINNVSIGTVTTTLPTSVTSPRINITKGVGSAARLFQIDYYELKYQLSNNR
jgi:hypothetical protein